MEGSQARFILLVQTLLPLSHNDIGDINKIINYLITPPSVSLTILFRLPTSPDQVPRWSLEKFKTNSCTGAPLWVEVHNPSRLLFSKPSSLLWVEIYIRSNKWTILSVRDPVPPPAQSHPRCDLVNFYNQPFNWNKTQLLSHFYHAEIVLLSKLSHHIPWLDHFNSESLHYRSMHRDEVPLKSKLRPFLTGDDIFMNM